MSGFLPRRALLLAPSAAALLGGIALLTLDERQERIPSVWQPDARSKLVGHKLPAFILPGLPGRPGFASADITATGRMGLINFFASWCMPCRLEAPALLSLKRQGLAIWGIDYQDSTDDAVAFLRLIHAPYDRVGCDRTGHVGLSFNLQGVPESFLVDRDGTVRWHWAGGLSEDVVRQYLDPLLRGGA
ncbi:MAG TPA: redoxin domain-containing protein [Acetobacteraceae bacterium]|nr:redoxin domain-containing protein [Acetobacteraceae bacterium]